VLRQDSLVEDKGQHSEPTMAILKKTSVKKKSIIDFDFLAMKAGFVGIVFKYINERNYYTFEIGGGDDVSKRFFQLRKKVDGAYSIIQRYNSPEEISSVPFFGYQLKTWYHVKVVLNNDQIVVMASLIGTTTLRKIMDVKDSAISAGRVGFSTYQTQALFSEILITPTPIMNSNISLIIKDERELPSFYSQATLEDDPIVLKFFEPAKNDPKIEDPKKPTTPSTPKVQNNKKPWEICNISKTPEQRENFCKKQFAVAESAATKCQVIIVNIKISCHFVLLAAKLILPGEIEYKNTSVKNHALKIQLQVNNQKANQCG